MRPSSASSSEALTRFRAAGTFSAARKSEPRLGIGPRLCGVSGPTRDARSTRLGVDPIAMEAVGNAMLKLHPGQRLARKIRRVNYYHLAAVFLRVVPYRKQETVVLGAAWMAGHEDRLAWRHVLAEIERLGTPGLIVALDQHFK